MTTRAMFVLLMAFCGTATAQAPGPAPMLHDAMPAMTMPVQPGQAAFAAMQEIVGLLRADPNTDWSHVDIDALREHLIDMDEVIMRAVATKRKAPGGLSIQVTGAGRTLAAIHRMVPAHARMMDGANGWHWTTAARPDGEELTVAAPTADGAAQIRALGFAGLMTLGQHHTMHHMAMALGHPPH